MGMGDRPSGPRKGGEESDMQDEVDALEEDTSGIYEILGNNNTHLPSYSPD